MASFLSALMLTVMSALVFLIGYSYVFSYFEFYSILPSELEFSPQDILVYSFASIANAFQNYFLLAFAILLTSFGLLNFGLEYGLYRAFSRSLVIGFPISGLALLLVALVQSSELGKDNAERDLRSLGIVQVVGENENSSISTFLDQDYPYSLRHLISTPSTHYLVALYRSGTDKWILRLPRNPNTALFVYQD